MAFCLTEETKKRFKKALKDREIDPVRLSAMPSLERRNFLAKYVGADSAKEVNALFESKLLIKNKKAGYISWAKKVSGITSAVRRDMLSKIERLDRVLDPVEEDTFLRDLAASRLGLEISHTEAKTIYDLSKKIQELRSKANKKGEFTTNEDRIQYGLSKVDIEKYINDLKLESRKIPFREKPVEKIKSGIAALPGIMKSLVASFDNSFWGRQGIKAFYTNPDLWTKNFLKSWKDLVKQALAKGSWYKSGDDAVLDMIRADIYSRPNAINGKYDAGGYGLGVLSEEAYPSAFPEKIPLLGRIFKASEVAYNGGALRLRADLADRMIKMAEDNGINTLDPREAQAIGQLVSSMTGRGSNYLKLTGQQQKAANVLLFSIKFLQSNIDTLTAHAFDPKATSYSKKRAGLALLRIVMTIAGILTLAKLLDPKSVEEDPRSTNFGKIKIFGHWTDITGGMGSLLTLASRMTPTMHKGKWSFWTKNIKGEYNDLLEGKYGQQTPMDVFNNFWEGKLSPAAGILRDIWKGQNYQGQKVSIENAIPSLTMPLTLQNLNQLQQDPTSTFILGSLILDGLGFSVSTQLPPNNKTNIIPEGKAIKNDNFIKLVLLYSEAMNKDPETAFNRIFTGQRIRKISGDAVIVERMTLSESQAIKKKAGAAKPTMKLDHTIPLELGGDNSPDNLKIVTTSQWSSYTAVENALGKALEEGKITKKEAQRLIVDLKNSTGTNFKRKKDAILKKY